MTMHKPRPPVRAVLFDMDGLLIDSEDMLTKSTNDILHKYGRPDIPWSIKSQLQGRPGPEAGKIFHSWAQLPITREEFMAQTVILQRNYFPQCRPLPGVQILLSNLSKTSNPPVYLALATSSHRGNFNIKTAHLGHVFSVFPENRRVMGDDLRIPAGRGKPAPDIYLLALKTINDELMQSRTDAPIQPEECLVMEDSVPGVEAGRRAGMQVVWCPHPGLLKEYHGREKEVLAGLTGQHKEDIVLQVDAANHKITGAPGEIDDGWATLLLTLENFPYHSFGLRM